MINGKSADTAYQLKVIPAEGVPDRCLHLKLTNRSINKYLAKGLSSASMGKQLPIVSDNSVPTGPGVKRVPSASPFSQKDIPRIAGQFVFTTVPNLFAIGKGIVVCNLVPLLTNFHQQLVVCNSSVMQREGKGYKINNDIHKLS